MPLSNQKQKLSCNVTIGCWPSIAWKMTCRQTQWSFSHQKSYKATSGIGCSHWKQMSHHLVKLNCKQNFPNNFLWTREEANNCSYATSSHVFCWKLSETIVLLSLFKKFESFPCDHRVASHEPTFCCFENNFSHMLLNTNNDMRYWTVCASKNCTTLF